MLRTGILVALGLAFGAVRAEAQSSDVAVKFSLARGPVCIGSAVKTTVVAPAIQTLADVHVIVGFAPGAGNVVVGNQSLLVPLDMPFVVAQGPLQDGVWRGGIDVPSDPALVGMRLWATAFISRPGMSATFAPLIPFGPIIEDSIQ